MITIGWLVFYEIVKFMGKTVAIVQSNYIPWKGYFDLINMVDEFILYDEVQYTRRDWRNRNQIKTQIGQCWMTIPVSVKGKYLQKINETEISTQDWTHKHCSMLSHNYSKAIYFQEFWPFFESVYSKCFKEICLSKVNFYFITAICELLQITTKISWSTDYPRQLYNDKTERLVDLCKQSGATRYVSGPLARNYMDVGLFDEANIELDYIDYSGYQKYPQLFDGFIHNVTVLDLIFNMGKNATKYMKSF